MAYPYSYLPSTGLPYHYGAAGVGYGYTTAATATAAAAATPFGYSYSALPQYAAAATAASPYSYVPQYTVSSPFGLSAYQASQVAQAQVQPKSGIKVIYFDLTGRAEATRLSLFIGGISFEDERLSHEEFRETLKDKVPFGQLPVLEVGGKYLAQSYAQLMFVGTLANLYPEDAWERARVNEALLLSEDFLQIFIPIRRAGDDEEKKKKAIEDATEKLPQMIGYIEKLLTETNTGYLAGPKLSIADINFYVFLDMLDQWFAGLFPADLFDSFPRTKEFRARIAALPRVAEWNALQERKKQEKEAAEKAKKEQEEAAAAAPAPAAASEEAPVAAVAGGEESAAAAAVVAEGEEQQ